jgi:DNA-binding CsgD family transcriptional regulator/tetratricopeptide (TPR) repeat protein
MARNHPAQRLRGRSDECETLDGLISVARSGQSQVLVLRGEAGVGKTALLEYLVERASGFRVARAAGVESEVELAFAGLHQLCAPMLDRLDDLPAPQRDALATAFGRSAGTPPDRFLVGLAVLSLLDAATEDQPLMCVVDDAQWLDRVSAQTLGFVARRLLAEPVALVFAVRDNGADELTGLPELPIRGLSDGDARALLDSVIRGRLDERVRDRIVAEARGNPLALLELPRDPATAEGGFGRPDGRPPAGRVEQSFLRRVQSLPIPTQRWLLTAAAEPVGDTALLIRAADRLGISADVAAPAEAAGLIEIGTRVRFRHPLMRSAAYHAADLHDRRQVHRALAEATDPESDPDRRAWHGANAATGADDAVADELERSADRAQARGGVAAAAAFLARATELTSDPARRGARALAAAEAKYAAAAPDAAYELLATAEMGPLDDLQGAQVARLRARIAFAESRGGDHGALSVADAAIGLLGAAKGFEKLDDTLSRETYLEALGAAMYAGRLCPHGGAAEVAEPARLAPPGPQPPRPTDLLLDGLAVRITEGQAVSLPMLRTALKQILDAARRTDGDVMRWFWQAFPIAAESATGELWDDDLWHRLATTAVRLARDTGALAVLPLALATRAGVHVHAGEFDAASTLIEEANAITAATGYAPLRYHSLSLAAWRGRDAEAVRLIEAAEERATARGEGRVIGLTGHAAAVLNNGLGRYQQALAAAQRACEHEDLGFYGWTVAELVEAGVRSGESDAANDALARLGELASAAGTDWALGALARSRALLADDRTAEDLYREAVERLGRTRMAVHLARAHLVYGEWLRRAHRRVDAREQLGIAHEMFGRMGAEAFAERARRELLATGEKARKRPVSSGDGLTAQEAQIAQLAGAGLTNQEIGAQLFISAHTVEWHLRKVFAKLGIRSRRQLRGRADAQ